MLFAAVLAIVVIGGIAGGIFFWNKWNKNKEEQEIKDKRDDREKLDKEVEKEIERLRIENQPKLYFLKSVGCFTYDSEHVGTLLLI